MLSLSSLGAGIVGIAGDIDLLSFRTPSVGRSLSFTSPLFFSSRLSRSFRLVTRAMGGSTGGAILVLIGLPPSLPSLVTGLSLPRLGVSSSRISLSLLGLKYSPALEADKAGEGGNSKSKVICSWLTIGFVDAVVELDPVLVCAVIPSPAPASAASCLACACAASAAERFFEENIFQTKQTLSHRERLLVGMRRPGRPRVS